jgi:hypothetical protein
MMDMGYPSSRDAKSSKDYLLVVETFNPKETILTSPASAENRGEHTVVTIERAVDFD